jgi:polyhydroxyalkanoate synthesis regulator phasin
VKEESKRESPSPVKEDESIKAVTMKHAQQMEEMRVKNEEAMQELREIIESLQGEVSSLKDENMYLND